MPRLEPFRQRPNRRERLDLKLDVYFPPRQVIDDRYVVSAPRQVEACRPSAKAVAAQNENARHVISVATIWLAFPAGALHRLPLDAPLVAARQHRQAGANSSWPGVDGRIAERFQRHQSML